MSCCVVKEGSCATKIGCFVTLYNFLTYSFTTSASPFSRATPQQHSNEQQAKVKRPVTILSGQSVFCNPGIHSRPTLRNPWVTLSVAKHLLAALANLPLPLPPSRFPYRELVFTNWETRYRCRISRGVQSGRVPGSSSSRSAGYPMPIGSGSSGVDRLGSHKMT